MKAIHTILKINLYRTFTNTELLVVISIISILSLCTFTYLTDKKTDIEQDIVNIMNQESVIEVYQDDTLVYEGIAKEYDFSQHRVEKINGKFGHYSGIPQLNQVL